MTIAVAAAAQASIGFGFSLLGTPVLVALLSAAEAVSAMVVLALISNLVNLGLSRRVALAVLPGEAARLVAWAVPGLPLGAVLLARLPDDAIRIAIGVVVLVAVALRAAPRIGALPRPAAGLAAGALSTATGLNGPPLIVRLTALPITLEQRRDTLATLFLVLGGVGLVALVAGSVFAPPGVTVPLAAVAVAASVAGRRLRIGVRVDRWAVTLLLVVAGVASIVAGLA